MMGFSQRSSPYSLFLLRQFLGGLGGPLTLTRDAVHTFVAMQDATPLIAHQRCQAKRAFCRSYYKKEFVFANP